MKRKIPSNRVAFYIICLTLLIVGWSFTDHSDAQQRSRKTRGAANKNSNASTNTGVPETSITTSARNKNSNAAISETSSTPTPAGYTGPMTRKLATEMILRHLKKEPYPRLTIMVSYSALLFPYGKATEETLRQYKDLAALFDRGYIQINGSQRVELTEKGKTASADWKPEPDRYGVLNSWTIAVATYEFIEVTGVSQKDNEALVTYTFKQKPINEIGEALGNYTRKFEYELKFLKFDDGWRSK